MDEDFVPFQHVLLQNNPTSHNNKTSWDTRSVFDKIVDDVELTAQVTIDDDNDTAEIIQEFQCGGCVSEIKNVVEVDLGVTAVPPSKEDKIFCETKVQKEDITRVFTDEEDSLPLLHTNLIKDKSDMKVRIADYLDTHPSDNDSGILETVKDDISSVDFVENDLHVLCRLSQLDVCDTIPLSACGECRTSQNVISEDFPLDHPIFISLNGDNVDAFDALNTSTQAQADIEWRESNNEISQLSLFPDAPSEGPTHLQDDLHHKTEGFVSLIDEVALHSEFEPEFPTPMFATSFTADDPELRETCENGINETKNTQQLINVVPLIRPPPEDKLKKWEEEQRVKRHTVEMIKLNSKTFPQPEEKLKCVSKEVERLNLQKITASNSVDGSPQSCISAVLRIRHLEHLLQTWDPDQNEGRSEPGESSGTTYREPYSSPETSQTKKCIDAKSTTTSEILTQPIFISHVDSELSREKAKQKWYARNHKAMSKPLDNAMKQDDFSFIAASRIDDSTLNPDKGAQETNETLNVSDSVVLTDNSTCVEVSEFASNTDCNVAQVNVITTDSIGNDTEKQAATKDVDTKDSFDSKEIEIDENISFEKVNCKQSSFHECGIPISASLISKNSIHDPILAEKITIASAKVSDKFEEEYKHHQNISQEIVEHEEDGMICNMLLNSPGEGLLDNVCSAFEYEEGELDGNKDEGNICVDVDQCIDASTFLLDTTTDSKSDNIVQSPILFQLSELSVSDKEQETGNTNVSPLDEVEVIDEEIHNNSLHKMKCKPEKSKMQHRRRTRSAQNDYSYMKPPINSPSPFEVSVSTQPHIIKLILSFLGNPASVCRVKCANKFVHQYIIENEHNLMRDSVRLGGLSKRLRPSFWLWMLLEKSNKIRTVRDECTEIVAVANTTSSEINDNEPHESNCESVKCHKVESSPPAENLESGIKGKEEEERGEPQLQEDSLSNQNFRDNPPIDNFLLLENLGRYGEWNTLIQRDVARAFGNLPPHKTGATISANSIVPALIYRPPLQNVISAEPSQISDSKPNNDDDSVSQASIEPTDIMSDLGAFPPGSDSFDDGYEFDTEEDDAVGDIDTDLRKKKPFDVGVLASSEFSPTKLSKRTQSDLTLSGNTLSAEAKLEMQNMLEKILNALSAAHPQVGYCQGMDYVVAHLLRVLKDTVVHKAKCGHLPSIIRSNLRNANGDDSTNMVIEETVFRSMDTFFTIYNLRHMYWPELRCLKMCCRIFEKLIQLKLPVLADHCDHHELNIGIFALGWFQTLFLYLPAMPSTTVCHMWDIWMVERSFKIFFRVGVAILFLSQPILLNHEYEGMMNYLNTFGSDVTLFNPDILITCALQFKITNRMLVELEQECLDEFR